MTARHQGVVRLDFRDTFAARWHRVPLGDLASTPWAGEVRAALDGPAPSQLLQDYASSAPRRFRLSFLGAPGPLSYEFRGVVSDIVSSPDGEFSLSIRPVLTNAEGPFCPRCGAAYDGGAWHRRCGEGSA